jgi:hypothetical protein
VAAGAGADMTNVSVRRSPFMERGNDLYETPTVAVEALLRVEQLPYRIWVGKSATRARARKPGAWPRGWTTIDEAAERVVQRLSASRTEAA